METIKSYTDLFQSKKLSEILPIESADMHYRYDNDFHELESIPTITEEDDHFILFPEDVRCWSLAALLNVLPNDTSLLYFDDAYQMVYDKKPYVISNKFDNPVDVCYEMILKLHELNLL